MSKPSFLDVLASILESLSLNNRSIIGHDLLSIANKKIETPVGDIFPLLTNNKSSLNDQFINFNPVYKILDNLFETKKIIGLNHIGFCYKVFSIHQEMDRLLKLIKNSKKHLYIEPSSDDEPWFFVGNTDNWEDPMVELIPIEKSKDKWIDYWLPHVQIDLDTTLTEGEINNYVKRIFGDSTKPFPIKIGGVCYIVRIRLGTIEGINLMLDLATNSRDVRYQRQVLLKRID